MLGNIIICGVSVYDRLGFLANNPSILIFNCLSPRAKRQAKQARENQCGSRFFKLDEGVLHSEFGFEFLGAN